MLKILYPCDPLNPRQCDECFAEEYAAALDQGLCCSLISFEQLQAGRLRVTPALEEADLILYRGWMQSAQMYRDFVRLLADRGATAAISTDDYLACHYLPNWYRLCAEFTAQTVILSSDEDVAATLERLDWPGYFVKDYVKSLNTGAGSIANQANQVAAIIEQLANFRGELEGGICLRRLESYSVDTERRYFVAGGQVLAPDGAGVPELVSAVAGRIDRPFFSIDVVANKQGQMRLVELGDGQVSDRKEWSSAQFAQVLLALASALTLGAA